MSLARCIVLADLRLQKLKSAFVLSLEQTEQRSLGMVQMSTAIIDRLHHSFKVVLDHVTSLETTENLRANISRAANRGRVTQSLGGLVDGCHDLLFLARLGFCQSNSGAGQSAGTNESLEQTVEGGKGLGATISLKFIDPRVSEPPLTICSSSIECKYLAF